MDERSITPPGVHTGGGVRQEGAMPLRFLSKHAGESERGEQTNSRHRYENALRLTRAGKKMDEIMTDRSPKGAICQRGEQGMYTDFATEFSPVEKKFRLWTGYPEAGVETLHLKNLLS